MHQKTFKMNIDSITDIEETEGEINTFLAEMTEVGWEVQREIIKPKRYDGSLKYVIFSFLCVFNDPQTKKAK